MLFFVSQTGHKNMLHPRFNIMPVCYTLVPEILNRQVTFHTASWSLWFVSYHDNMPGIALDLSHWRILSSHISVITTQDFPFSFLSFDKLLGLLLFHCTICFRQKCQNSRKILPYFFLGTGRYFKLGIRNKWFLLCVWKLILHFPNKLM